MKVLIFGGTTEGRQLAATLATAGIKVTVSVATEFGQNMVTGADLTVLTGRLEAEDIANLLRQGAFEHVIDATHPYAVLAAENIRAACQLVGVNYLSLKRPAEAITSEVIPVPDAFAAVAELKKSTAKALLTIGSKDLEPFTTIENYAERLFIRILPMEDSLKKALELGFNGSNIIAMQGPFSKEINQATLKMIGAKYLVTKDAGASGGFEAKVSAALELGCQAIVISRPVQATGYTFAEVLAFFKIKPEEDKPAAESKEQKRFFPLFLDLAGKKVVVVGGGKIAERRLKVLASFGADITVISPQATADIAEAAQTGNLQWLKREFQNDDIASLAPLFVVAATDSRQVNQAVKLAAEKHNLPASIADNRAECTCYFPAIAEGENYLAGLVSKNGDHKGVKYLAEQIRSLLNK